MSAEGPGYQDRKVSLRFSDGVQHVVRVAEHDTVLAASIRTGIQLVHQCMSGSCGTCVGRLTAGTLRMRSEKGHCLLPSEMEGGQRLLCLSSPLTDACIQLDYPSSFLQFGAPTRASARVAACDWVSESVVRLVLEIPDDSEFDFRSGQYVRLRVPGIEQWRSYSMASTPAELPTLVLLVRVLSEGAMSDYLRGRCVVEDVVEIDGPHGAFSLRESRAPHVMIAGGTGLAPIMAMLDQIRRLAGKRPKVVVSFGCASPEHLFYVEELQARADWMPNLQVRISVDRPAPGYSGAIGNPVQAITASDVSDADTVAYVCGPAPMITAARSHLRSLGVDLDHVFTELFSPSAQASSCS